MQKPAPMKESGDENRLLAVQGKSAVALGMFQVGFRKPYTGPHLQAFSSANIVGFGSVEGLLKTGWF